MGPTPAQFGNGNKPHRLGKVAKLAKAVAMLQPEDLEGVWDDHALPLVVWWWDALEGPEPVQGCCAALGLVWDHAAAPQQASPLSD